MPVIKRLLYRDNDNHSVVVLVYVSYNRSIRKYLASIYESTGDFEHTWSENIEEAINSAIKVASVKYGEPVQTTTVPPEKVRIVRWAGVPAVVDSSDIALTLTEDSLHEISRMSVQELAKYLRIEFQNTLTDTQQGILQEWLSDGSKCWAYLPADAQKACSEDFDYDPDEPIEHSLEKHLIHI